MKKRKAKRHWRLTPYEMTMIDKMIENQQAYLLEHPQELEQPMDSFLDIGILAMKKFCKEYPFKWEFQVIIEIKASGMIGISPVR